VVLSDGTATKEMNGVSAPDLQRATLASLGMVFAQIATIDEVVNGLLASSVDPRAPIEA
jgi:biuret amidohydrolase